MSAILYVFMDNNGRVVSVSKKRELLIIEKINDITMTKNGAEIIPFLSRELLIVWNYDKYNICYIIKLKEKQTKFEKILINNLFEKLSG